MPGPGCKSPEQEYILPGHARKFKPNSGNELKVKTEEKTKKNSGYSLLGPALKSAQRRICFNFLP